MTKFLIFDSYNKLLIYWHQFVRTIGSILYIIAENERKLLVSGWWGKASHINYLGDWLLSLSQCLACGFNSIIPYMFAGYFAILLIHRDSRDDYECSKKYGKT